MRIVRNNIERGIEVMEKEGPETPESDMRRAAIRVGGLSNLRKKGDGRDGARSGDLLGRRQCRGE
jgi:hypothetical protein